MLYYMDKKTTPLLFIAYYRFNGLRARCENPNHIGYRRYGGRGIKCLVDRESFIKWFFVNAEKLGYVEGMEFPRSIEIDRINNDGHYEFSNMRLITKVENTRKAYREVPRIAEVGQINMDAANARRQKRVRVGNRIFPSLNAAGVALMNNRCYVKNRVSLFGGLMPDGTEIEVLD